MMKLLVIFIVYILSIQYCRVIMKKVVIKNGWSFEFYDIVISFVPILNIGLATFFTIELLINKLDKKYLYKMNKQMLIKKFFNL